MSIIPDSQNLVSPLTTGQTSIPALPGAGKSEKSLDSFGDLLEKLMSDANAAQKNSDTVIEGFVSGKVDNIHDVVLAVAEADLSFRLIMEIRNKLIDSYQEIMRMQM